MKYILYIKFSWRYHNPKLYYLNNNKQKSLCYLKKCNLEYGLEPNHDLYEPLFLSTFSFLFMFIEISKSLSPPF